jgi:uncharacterized protein YecE (DUF72 family)
MLSVMRWFTGTSGYSYDEWKGTFYPTTLKKDGMLSYYAGQLPAVEVNNTFYRMPRASVVEKWREETPPEFRFVLKASRRITHFARLEGTEETLGYFFEVADVLGGKLGPVLFQMPPTMKKNVTVLDSFLSSLPKDRRAALEFRHASWFEDEVYEVLSRHGAALVGGDLDDPGRSPPFVRTASFGYLRLRREDYTEADLDAWYSRIADQDFSEVFAFFKHEVKGPELARSLLERAGP